MTVYEEYGIEVDETVVYGKRLSYVSHDESLKEAVKLEVGDARFDDLVPHYLEKAKREIVARIWPYDLGKTWEDVPTRFHLNAVEIAAYLINRRGAEGETSHSESGTSRSYESAGIPDSFFRGITPHVGVPS